MAGKMGAGTGSREAYWRGHVEARARSGESVRGYCRSRGLSEAGFHFWKRELKRRDAGAACRRGGLGFTEVRLPSSVMREALNEIAFGNWTALTRYLDDGILDIENNEAEQALRALLPDRRKAALQS